METVGKPITCRAAVVWKAKDPFKIETVEVDTPQKEEVRIRMISSGLCHSDLHMKDGLMTGWQFPTLLGHEGAGIVESVGEGVTSIEPGDLVVTLFEAYCGSCVFCKDPRTNQCMNQPRNNLQRDGTSRITCKGQKLSQMMTLGTFSEYTVASVFNVAKVNPKADPYSIALASCCLPTGYGAVVKTGEVPPGATCAIWGLGGVGMCTVMGCRDSGASKIIGIDINSKKFDLAKELGCTDVLNSKEVADVPQVLADMTNGGVDFCFVSVGSIPALEQAFKSSHPAWGKTIAIGISAPEAQMRVGIMDLIFGKQIMGCLYGSYKAKLGVPGLVEKIVKGQIQADKLITHRLPLDKINEGFEMLRTGESLRSIIQFDMKS